MNEMMRKLLFLPEQASTVASRIDWLHFFVITVTMLGATGVALVTLYYIVKYRARMERGEDMQHDVEPRRVRAPLTLRFELVVFGGLLALFVLFWVIGFRQFVHLAAPPRDAMTIYVTGKQWMWDFAYPNGTGSNAVLYVPAGRPVKLVMTSRDVIHSFFVPAFRVKHDVVPGRSTTLWFEVKKPGRYPVYCTEYCGADHSTMRAEVVALTDADFERQMTGLAPAPIATADVSLQTFGAQGNANRTLSLAAMGERVAAERGCFRCHTPDGTPHIGPTFAGLFDARIPLDSGQTVTADEAYLTASMMDPAAQIHRGFPNVMPSYQGLLTAGEAGALVEYIRSLRDVHRYRGNEPLPTQTSGVPLVTPLTSGQQQQPGPQQKPGSPRQSGPQQSGQEQQPGPQPKPGSQQQSGPQQSGQEQQPGPQQSGQEQQPGPQQSGQEQQPGPQQSGRQQHPGPQPKPGSQQQPGPQQSGQEQQPGPQQSGRLQQPGQQQPGDQP